MHMSCPMRWAGGGAGGGGEGGGEGGGGEGGGGGGGGEGGGEVVAGRAVATVAAVTVAAGREGATEAAAKEAVGKAAVAREVEATAAVTVEGMPVVKREREGSKGVRGGGGGRGERVRGRVRRKGLLSARVCYKDIGDAAGGRVGRHHQRRRVEIVARPVALRKSNRKILDDECKVHAAKGAPRFCEPPSV